MLLIILGVIAVIVGIIMIVFGEEEVEDAVVGWGIAVIILGALLAVSGIIDVSVGKSPQEDTPVQVTEGLFANTPSGYEFELNCESPLNIRQSFTFAEESNGYIPSANAEVTISGYEELSYFDAAVTFIWTYEILDEAAGSYVEEEYVATVELDAQGNGQLSEQIEFFGCRRWKNLSLILEFDGYAIKK